MNRYLPCLLSLALLVGACKEPEPPKVEDQLVIFTTELTASPEGQELELSLKSNVTVEASVDVDWMTVDPPSKALVEKQFTLQVQPNESGEARVGHVTFTAGTKSQQVTVSQEALPPPPDPQTEYRLLLHADDLMEGDELLLVNQAGTYAMGAQNVSHRLQVAVTVEDESIVDLGDGVAVVTLAGDESGWILRVSDGYLAAPEESKNRLLTISQPTDYARWKISVQDGIASIKALAGDRNLICYNSRDTRFVCAAEASSSLSKVAIYLKVKENESVTRYDACGFYLGGIRERVYHAGTDQMVRSYSGSSLRYGLLDLAEREQIRATGYSTSMQVGDDVTLSVEWRKGWNTVISRDFEMKVLKDEGGKVWIGDTRGRGVIMKK